MAHGLQKRNWILPGCGAMLVIYACAGLMNMGLAWLPRPLLFHWINLLLLCGIFLTGIGAVRRRRWAWLGALGIFLFYLLSGLLHLSLLVFSKSVSALLARPAWMIGLNIVVGALGYLLLGRLQVQKGQGWKTISPWRIFLVAMTLALGIFILLGLNSVFGAQTHA